ncbi:50S ribosomal protein L20 [Haliovirga abyssi]|uniref:Large ribosomal subunit protein bL20 n=1 Tax=Haliovirga abyssi TaxID=2996794 RepID=A0AAU9DLI2_9FUSO|nr:50S ribosomal protein L20 [Haliovirga abyssi]BDU50817.1 50S ribosomal protein L20 [Haliovirga abyssi]
MARVKTGKVRRQNHKKVLDEAKGFRGASGTNFKQAKQAVMRAMAFSTRDRAQRKRKMRELWVIRINAAARLSGLSYSKFMYGLKKAGIELNRKVLAELAVSNAEEFAKLVEVSKKSL